MHCINTQSAALVAAVVPALIEEGYQFVRLDQMPEYRKYETPGGGGAQCAGFQIRRRTGAICPRQRYQIGSRS